MKVGVSKPDNSEVKAVGVYDFLPMVKLLSTKNLIVVCDDMIEDELPEEKRLKPQNNDLLLYTQEMPEKE